MPRSESAQLLATDAAGRVQLAAMVEGWDDLPALEVLPGDPGAGKFRRYWMKGDTIMTWGFGTTDAAALNACLRGAAKKLTVAYP